MVKSGLVMLFKATAAGKIGTPTSQQRRDIHPMLVQWANIVQTLGEHFMFAGNTMFSGIPYKHVALSTTFLPQHVCVSKYIAIVVPFFMFLHMYAIWNVKLAYIVLDK